MTDEHHCPWAPFWCVHRGDECSGNAARNCLYLRLHAAVPLGASLETLSPISAAGLSRRELGVLEAVLHDGSLESVAKTLHISPHTVSNHLRTIRRKLGVRTMADLFRSLLECCLVAAEGPEKS